MTLAGDLHQVEQDHPGWHAWQSDKGHLWAVSTRDYSLGGCGVTLDAADPVRLGQEITAFERQCSGWLAA